MADGARGKADLPALATTPPSTLAAQLVEKISTSARSSRSDDNGELKALFATIQHVKDNPELIEAHKDRVEHNHTLIYLYCRVALDGIQLDDPFMDRALVRTELIKAINFLRFTIKETPAVLLLANHDRKMPLERGQDPLWIWLLPYLLRVLGRAGCLELGDSIEGFFHYLLLVISRNNTLWGLEAPLSLYLRACLTGLIDQLQILPLNFSSTKASEAIRLPAQSALDQILGQDRCRDTHRITYSISSAPHALRQAFSLAKVLTYPFLSRDSSLLYMASFAQSGPWLMDALLDLRHVQLRWEGSFQGSPASLIEIALEVSQCPFVKDGLASPLKNKASTILVLLCNEMVTCSGELVRPDSAGDKARQAFCKALVSISETSLESYATGRLAASKLVHEFALLSSEHPVIGLHTDVWKCTEILRHIVYRSPQRGLDIILDPLKFESKELGERVANLKLDFETTSTEKAAKRRKLPDAENGLYSQLVQLIYQTLGLEPVSDDATSISEDLFLEGFEKSAVDSQSLSIDLLSRICCAIDGNHSMTEQPLSLGEMSCSVCDNPSGLVHSVGSHAAKKEARSLFIKLLQLPAFLESKRPRVVAMIALRRIIVHCDDPAFLDLATPGPGQWCLQSLNSSIRELRIAAGRTITWFLAEWPLRALDENLLFRNRQTSIALLKSTSENDKPHLTETRIMAWGQMGRVVLEEELNLVLIKLLEYLGSSNGIVSACAFNELLNLAAFRSTTTRRLFEPFWKNLAYMVTRDMVHRPQRSRALAELLQISVNQLLLLIQAHALPWLVLEKRVDVIQKIADARQEKDLWRPMMDGTNLAAVLALLLVQDTDDMGGFVMSALSEISAHFRSLSILDLFQSEPVLIALELLKASASADVTRKPVYHKALQLMATTILRNNKDTRHRANNAIGRFLQSHVLGLLARLVDVINDPMSVNPPVLNQRSAIRTLEEIVRVCKSYARTARPQISACLLSAVSQDPLREVSFSCWATMLTNLEEEDVEALIETTFFIINRYWASFDTKTATAARELLTFLLDKHGPIVESYISRLPSMSHLAELSDVESRLRALRPVLSIDEALHVFAKRASHDNSGVVLQALTELVPFLRSNQNAIYTSAVSQRENSAITKLLRTLLDCACKYNGALVDITRLCVEAIGLIGCLDSNQVEAVRDQRSIVVLDNFESSVETLDFVLFLLQEVLVPSFLSATDTRLQGFLSFAIQELLSRCDIKAACAMQTTGVLDGNDIYRKWIALPENVREVVSPFLTSRYMVAPMPPVTVEYPIFHPGKPYNNWLRVFVMDLLRKGQHGYADLIFEPLIRVIRVKDLSTAEFLLPYLVMHVFLGPRSSEDERGRVTGELMAVLGHRPAEDASFLEKEEMKRFCHAVFRVVDYAMRWIHAKRSAGRLSSAGKESISRIQSILDSIPAELISQRATDCNEFARALFHLEQHAQQLEQQKGGSETGDRNRLLEKLQDIYANIDEPDGLEGILAHLQTLNINQQILSHKKSGRWAAAQTWHEMQLAEKPDNLDVQLDLLNCLKQAGQYEVLLNHVDGMQTDQFGDHKIMPFAVEAAWVANRWESLRGFVNRFHGSVQQDFNISVAAILDLLHSNYNPESLAELVRGVREKMASELTQSATSSLQAAHDLLLKCHVLSDLDIIAGSRTGGEAERKKTVALLDGRLELLGAYSNDKQYLLGIRRAAMGLLRPTFGDLEISSSWLASARLYRKSGSLQQSFNAVLHASQLGDDAATIENAKLLWRDRHHRKAIQMLQGAIEGNKIMAPMGPSVSQGSTVLNSQQRLLRARAQLLLAKWYDAAGHFNAGVLREKYQQPPKTCPSWEKGHYYLGRHYKKILESEQPLKADDQSDSYITGEVARLVIENYLRSLYSGTKYLYQTLPRILTLWLDLGAEVDQPPEGKASLSWELQKRRMQQLKQLHSFLDKYIHRLPAYIFYTALPQIVARIAHPNVGVFERLTQIIVKVVEAHPRQALWSLIGIMTSRQVSERKTRGTQILQTLRAVSRKVDGTGLDLKHLLRAGERLAEQLLVACSNGDFQGSKTVHASLSRDLRFQHKCTPCPLVVPVESSLTATLPAVSEQVRKHEAFSPEVVTIECFLDDVLVLSSLAKPRRMTARGSDGKSYMLLVKPKDDLRTDQRLMEFNGMINRSLKRDAESSRRRLYIRTYAVVPLNEECGIIEWVPGIRTMREILLSLYASHKIHPDYVALKSMMEEAASSESKVGLFTDEVLGRFPPMLPTWFIQQFPNPSAWFAARLRYTRSCAVMSMVGTILGLGDRHGENVNLEEGNGGIFHVDFNCLFDKGLTFLKPERVPFRLTHNMVAAMGSYGYEGPFRKSSELTLSILRQQEETLMTILESFIYDPTLDLQKEKRASRKGDAGVRLQPRSVVNSIKRKLRGLLPNESIPLSVEGQVEELIKQAVDARNLAAMYIGWCPFL